MHGVRDSRAGRGDRKSEKPVRRGNIAPRLELPQNAYQDHNDFDSCPDCLAVCCEVVRGGLSCGGSQKFHHPEKQRNLGNFSRQGFWKPTI